MIFLEMLKFSIFNFLKAQCFPKEKKESSGIFWNLLFFWGTGKWNLQILFIDLVIFKLING
jgi:hypothetical protein